MVPVLIFSLFSFSILLIKASDLVIIAIRRISRKTKTKIFALSAVILALSTSLPELFIGITSAIEKSSNLSLGVVIGSNIANISLVAGFSALVVGKVGVYGEFLKRDVGIALLSGILPLLLLLDGSLNRVDGLILLAIYGAYSTGFFKSRYEDIVAEHRKESFVYRFIRKFNHIDSTIAKESARFFIGVALLLFSADMIVKITKLLTVSVNIPVFVVGLIILAIGSSLPEVAFSFRSLEDHQPSMFFGNLLGSTIANSTLVLGITSIIYPIEGIIFSEYVIATIAFLIIALLFWLFIKSKSILDRREAAILVFLYIIFLILESF